ncbi:unnamed protein product [Symbiodinium microadriaticum]|nr:unnamed protein product [Symbiodinium microadriaticum]
MAEYTLASFLPLFFLNKFPEQKLSFSVINALIILAVGLLSSVLGSSSSEVLALDKPGSVRGSCSLLILLITCTILSIPALLLTLLSPSFYLSIFGLFIVYLLTEWWARPFLFVFQRELSPEARNIALGFFSMAATLSGSVATTVVGYFIGRKDDNLHGNVHVPPKNVTITLSWAVGVIYFLSVALFAIVYIMIVQDVDKEEDKILRALGIDGGEDRSGERCTENDMLLCHDENSSDHSLDEAAAVRSPVTDSQCNGDEPPLHLKEINL